MWGPEVSPAALAASVALSSNLLELSDLLLPAHLSHLLLCFLAQGTSSPILKVTPWLDSQNHQSTEQGKRSPLHRP